MTLQQQKIQQVLLSTAHSNYKKSLNSYAFFKVNDRNTGEDLVQDTFKKTWMYMLGGGKIVTMKSFLYHILNNLIIDEYRRRKNRTSSLDTLIEKGFEPVNEDSERIFDIIDGKIAMLLIEKLPENYQNVLRLKYLEDMSITNIAVKTKETKNTVTVKIHRGIQKLKLLQAHS